MIGLVRRARREVARCQRAIELGSPAGFWIRRLMQGAEELERAAAILRAELTRLTERGAAQA